MSVRLVARLGCWGVLKGMVHGREGLGEGAGSTLPIDVPGSTWGNGAALVNCLCRVLCYSLSGLWPLAGGWSGVHLKINSPCGPTLVP